MKKILLPTDFSDNAWNAITYALEFFKDEKCEFYFLHTYTPTFYRVDYMMGGPTYSALPDMGVDIAQAGLDKTLTDVRSKYSNKNHQFKTLSAFNMLTDEIQELSETKNFDLIVMGTQGATGAKEIFLGTHTVHVIRKSKIPVMAIPEGYSFKEVRSIVFPTDYANPINENDIKFLIGTVKMHEAKLTILNVNDHTKLTKDQNAHKQSLSVFFNDLDHTFEQVSGQEMPNAIHEYIEHKNIGLLAMLSRNHSFLERLIVKSKVDSIGFHTKVPFLVMRDTANGQSK
ncbi:MAG: universal stress protein [Pricia sp.]|nr:universal stress protein [Pricia sp.]